jgi:hypothetical protein
MELSISVSCVFINLSISESVITFSPSPVPTRRLCTFCEPTLLVVFGALNLILNCPGLELAVAVYRGYLIIYRLIAIKNYRILKKAYNTYIK